MKKTPPSPKTSHYKFNKPREKTFVVPLFTPSSTENAEAKSQIPFANDDVSSNSSASYKVANNYMSGSGSIDTVIDMLQEIPLNYTPKNVLNGTTINNTSQADVKTSHYNSSQSKGHIRASFSKKSIKRKSENYSKSNFPSSSLSKQAINNFKLGPLKENSISKTPTSLSNKASSRYLIQKEHVKKLSFRNNAAHNKSEHLDLTTPHEVSNSALTSQPLKSISSTHEPNVNIKGSNVSLAGSVYSYRSSINAQQYEYSAPDKSMLLYKRNETEEFPSETSLVEDKRHLNPKNKNVNSKK